MCYNEAMKAKTTMIIQTIGMYLTHLPLYVMLITLPMPMDPDFQSVFYRVLLYITLALMVLMIPVCILNAVTSISSAIKGKEDPTRVTMIAKLSLIPWYILNVVICAVCASIFLNPFMMIAIPFVVAFFIVVTYILMLCSSLGDITYFIYNHKRKVWRDSVGMILAFICLFIFCLDVVGAIVLYRKSQGLPLPESTDAPFANE